jgi:hypothetical protein
LFKEFVTDLESEDPYYPVRSAAHQTREEHEQNISPMSILIWQSMDKSSSARARQYLSFLCSQNKKAQCEKEVDKIFGLWALAPACCQHAIPVDYSFSLDQVLGNVFEHNKVAHDTPWKHLDREEGLEVLWDLIFGE